MNKKISKSLFLITVLALMVSCETAPKSKNETVIMSESTTSDTKINNNKKALGTIALKYWFGMTADQLKGQVKNAKEVYSMDSNDKKLIGLESKENWFGKNIRVFYSLAGENNTLNQIILTYENPDYEALIRKMTEDLGEPVSRKTADENDSFIQSAEFIRNGIHFNVVDYPKYVDIYLTPAD